MKEITLTITVDEANQILEALSYRPFRDVFSLINKIQNQVAAQLEMDERPEINSGSGHQEM
jgi:hypothetical protein